MKSDRLEKYVEEHLSEFNSDEPRLGHFERFRKKLEESEIEDVENVTKKNWRKMLLWSGAATLVFLLLSGFGLFKLNQNQMEQTEGVFTAQLEEFERDFNREIEKRMANVNLYASADNRAYISETVGMISSLEKDYEVLKDELAASGDDKRIFEAIVQNLKLRADMLNKLNSKLDYSENLKNTFNANYKVSEYSSHINGSCFHFSGSERLPLSETENLLGNVRSGW